MGKEDNLGFFGEICQNLQGYPGSVIIKINQNIIDDKRHWLTGVYSPFQSGEAQGKIELVPCSRAHFFH